MHNLLRSAVLAGAAAVSGCSYFPTPPDPIRYVTSPADVVVCRRLGSVGIARTDGVGPFDYSVITVVEPEDGQPHAEPLAAALGWSGREIPGPNFAVRLNVMRDSALALGATDLLLSRRFYHDYSYVEGIAYDCNARPVARSVRRTKPVGNVSLSK